jgi:transketolase
MAENETVSKIEMRDAFGDALIKIGQKYPQVVVLDADLNTSSKTIKFKKAFPTVSFRLALLNRTSSELLLDWR